jgi:DNA-binding protein YbaB
MDTNTVLAAINAERRRLQDELSKIQEEMANLEITEGVVRGLPIANQGEATVQDVPPTSIKDRVLRVLGDGGALAPKDLMQKLNEEGDFKYASVMSDVARMRKNGILEQQDGKYFVALKSEKPNV